MKLIQFKVTEQLIRQSLAIPDGAEIINIVRHEFVPGLFTFYVTHPSFPECVEGALPVEADPVITANYENRPETWLTIDFRIPISAAEQSAHPTDGGLAQADGESNPPAISR
jgi:hypothetical protein